MKKIVIVNAGPRKGFNTDTLLRDAEEALKEEGNEVRYFDLYRLEAYTGCVSCFGCKKEKFKGTCIKKDGLAPVLEAVRGADGLIVGSPNYFSDLTAAFRAFYERLLFPYLTYNAEHPSCNERSIPVLLLMTSNAPKGMYASRLEEYRNAFSRFVGPTTLYHCDDTMQLRDYSKTDWPWTYFDPEHKKLRHEEVFPKQREEFKALSKKIFG